MLADGALGDHAGPRAIAALERPSAISPSTSRSRAAELVQRLVAAAGPSAARPPRGRARCRPPPPGAARPGTRRRRDPVLEQVADPRAAASSSAAYSCSTYCDSTSTGKPGGAARGDRRPQPLVGEGRRHAYVERPRRRGRVALGPRRQGDGVADGGRDVEAGALQQLDQPGAEQAVSSAITTRRPAVTASTLSFTPRGGPRQAGPELPPPAAAPRRPRWRPRPATAARAGTAGTPG